MPVFFDENPTDDVEYNPQLFGSFGDAMSARLERAAHTSPWHTYNRLRDDRPGLRRSLTSEPFRISEGFEESADRVSKQEADKQLAIHGVRDVEVSPLGTSQSYLDDIINERLLNNEWNRAAEAGSRGWASASAGFAIDIAGSMADPVNVAMMYAGGGLVGAGLKGMSGTFATRMMARAKLGAIEGAISTAALEPLVAEAHHDMLLEYSNYDSMQNILTGMIAGASLEVGFGSMGDAMRKIFKKTGNTSAQAAHIEAMADLKENPLYKIMDTAEGLSYKGLHPDNGVRTLLFPDAAPTAPVETRWTLGGVDYVNAEDLIANAASAPKSLKRALDDARLKDPDTPTSALAEATLRQWMGEHGQDAVNAKLFARVLDSPEVAEAINAKTDINRNNPAEMREALGYRPKNMREAIFEIRKEAGEDVSYRGMRKRLEAQDYIRKGESRASVEKRIDESLNLKGTHYTNKVNAEVLSIMDKRMELKRKYQKDIDSMQDFSESAQFTAKLQEQSVPASRPSFDEMQARAKFLNSPQAKPNYEQTLYDEFAESQTLGGVDIKKSIDEINEMRKAVAGVDDTATLEALRFSDTAHRKLEGFTAVLDCILENIDG